MKTIKVKATDKEGKLIEEFELEVPESYEECALVPGEAKTLAYVVDKMKIAARTKFKPHAGVKGILPKGTQKLVRESLKAGDLTEEDLIEFIKMKRGG